MWRQRLRQHIYRLGSQPQRSVRLFFSGLGLFALGVAGFWAYWQGFGWLRWPAWLLLISGFILAGRGYIGIFANRFSQVLRHSEKAQTPPE